MFAIVLTSNVQAYLIEYKYVVAIFESKLEILRLLLDLKP